MRRQTHFGGFTLLEMSIVLIAIALVVGGVLVGRDLISAAMTRRQVSQLQEITSAVFTFKARTTYIPGDLPADEAASFGLESRNGMAGNGDNNGAIESSASGGGCGEPVLFWDDLAKLQLIDHTPAFTGDYPNDCVVAVTYSSAARQFSRGRIGRDEFLFVLNLVGATDGGVNMLGLTRFNDDYMTATGLTGSLPALSPAEAYHIDSKMDDGMPATGKIIGGIGLDLPPMSVLPLHLVGLADNECVQDIGGDINNTPYYLSDPAKVSAVSCGLWYLPPF